MNHKYYLRFLWGLCLLTASTLVPTFAQTSSIVWNRTIENYLDQIKMATTSDGGVGVIVTGTRPGRPIELTKLDPSGNVAWKKGILGTPFSGGNFAVQQLYLLESTLDGGFVVVARESSPASGNVNRFTLTKFDTGGNQLWVEFIDDSFSQAPLPILLPQTITSTNDGGFIISGEVSNIRQGSSVELYKHNSSGKQEWRRVYVNSGSGSSGSFPSLFISDVCERNQGYALVGSTSEFQPNTGQIITASVLLLLNSAGDESTRKAYTSEFGFTSIDYNRETNGFIVASTNSQGRGVLGMNSLGDVLFRTVIPRRAGESQAYVAFAPNPQDGYIVADTDPVNEADFRLTRISRDGSQQTSQTFGGRQADYLQALDFQPNGNIILAGVTQSTDRDLAARQSVSPISSAPVAWILSLNTSGTTPPVNPPVTPPSGFVLTTPAYDCNTGQLTINTMGSNGAAVEYRIVGNRDWSASNVFTIPAYQRQGTTFTLDARIVGGNTISIPFTSACGTTPPVTPPVTPPTGTPLSFGGSSLICDTGQLTINAMGGDGTPIEFKVPGLADWQRSNTFQIPIYQRNGTTFTLYIRQSGREVQTSYTPGCAAARMAVSAEAGTGLNAVVLPNPVLGNELVVEVTGAAGQAVDFALTDVGGRVLTTQRAAVTTDRHRQTLAVGQLIEGVYLLRVSTINKTKTVKVMKQ